MGVVLAVNEFGTFKGNDLINIRRYHFYKIKRKLLSQLIFSRRRKELSRNLISLKFKDFEIKLCRCTPTHQNKHDTMRSGHTKVPGTLQGNFQLYSFKIIYVKDNMCP